MSEQPTPETDAAVIESNGQWSFILKETCQKLERERDEANKELHKQLVRYDQLFDDAEKIRIERDEARIDTQKAKAYKRVLKVTNAQLKRERDDAREVLERIVKLSIHARCVEEDYAEWEKAVLAILDLCEERKEK